MDVIIPATARLATLTIWSAIVVAVIFVLSKWRRQHQIRSLKKLHNCQEPAHFPHSDAWGSDLVAARMAAMKEGRYFPLYEKHFRQYGKTFAERVRGQTTINTTEPVNIQQILALSFDDYGKDPKRVKAQSPFLGTSIFSDGLQWKRSRAMVKPVFARAELRDLDQFEGFAERFVELLPVDGSTVDIQPLLHRLFLDVSMNFLFGRSMDALQKEVPAECTEFLQAFAKAQRWVTKRRESGWLAFRYDYDKDWIQSYSVVHRFVDEQVQKALRATEMDSKSKSDQEPGRDRYILLDELVKQTRDPIQLRYQILGVFLPARDTTSVLVGNTLWELARHPHIWTQLRKTALSLGDTPLTFETMKTLHEFRHVLHETIRHVGPAARIVRIATQDTILPRGGGEDQSQPIFVPRGTNVSMGIWCMNHDPDIWGPDAHEFKPERWVDRRTYWDFLPFSGGPRICPAQQQVLTHATYLLIRLVKEFEVMENRDDVLEYVEKFTMGFENRSGVKVAFKWA